MKVQGIPTFKGQGEVEPAKVPEEEQWGEEENLESIASLSQGDGVFRGSVKWNYCFN